MLLHRVTAAHVSYDGTFGPTEERGSGVHSTADVPPAWEAASSCLGDPCSFLEVGSYQGEMLHVKNVPPSDWSSL